MAKLVSNRALMILLQSFFLRFVSPHYPAVQGFVELARPDHSLTNPVKQRPAWNVKLAGQFGWPPFIRQEPLMVLHPRAWCFHPYLALQLRDGLRAKASGGTGRAKARLVQNLRHGHGSPARFGQLPNLLADL